MNSWMNTTSIAGANPMSLVRRVKFQSIRIGTAGRLVAGHVSPIVSVVCLAVVGSCLRVRAEPVPGDVYREYTYTNTYGDAGGAIRVGGKKGVSYPDRGSDFGYVNAWVEFPHQLDLTDATRAELVVEKILSHNGTKDLAVQWNESEWMSLPEPKAIPLPRQNYYHHAGITIPVPLAELRARGEQNRFRMRVSPQHDWNWPQHLVYGVHLRVFYDAEKKTHVTAKLTSPVSGEAMGQNVPLAIEISSAPHRVNRVDYLGKYEGLNWEGDGQYRRWHYFYYHGQLIHHLASAVVAPFDERWDTAWVPDQNQPIEIAARVIDDTGLIVMTSAVTDLRLQRPGLSVELCKPTDVPQNWVTRKGSHQQEIVIDGNLADAVSARLAWSSWSPGYMEGVLINGVTILDREGPKYRYYDHLVDLPDLSMLRPGKNVISTGKTPLHDGKMVHGMEVNWPGIQLLIQYQR